MALTAAQWVFVVVAAACAAGVVVAAIRLRAPAPLLWALACLPVAAILCKEDVRVFSYHGFLHTGLVYRILEGGLPPTDPFFAGGPTSYAWGHHAVVAALVRLLDLPPPTVFALTNVAMLALTVLLLDRAAALAGFAPPERVLGVALALYGVSAFSRGPLWHGLRAATGIEVVERILPVEKFAHANSNGVGILCFALYLMSALRLVGRGEGRRSAAWLGLFASTLGAAVLYPLSWLPLVASASVCGGLLLLADPKERWRTTAGFAGVLIAATLVATPYLLQLQAGRGEPGFLGLTPSADLLDKGVTVASVLALVGVVGWIFRGELVRISRASPEAILVLVAATAVCLALYTAVHLRAYTEYKFLQTATLPLGLLVGPPLAALYRRLPVAAFGVVWLALMPAATHGAELLFARLGPTSQIRTEGRLMLQTDPARAALDEWIRRETPADAVFVDSELSIPTFAHRSVFALLDRGWISLPGGDTLDGWTIPASYMLYTSFGHPKEAILRRYGITLRLLSRQAAPPLPADVADLRRLAGTDHIYLVVRDTWVQRTPDASLPFERVYGAGRIQVFRLRPPQAAARHAGPSTAADDAHP